MRRLYQFTTSGAIKFFSQFAVIIFLFIYISTASPCVLSAQTAISRVPPDHLFAILIGISEYEDKRLPRLLGPVNDVQAMRDVLMQSAGFLDSNIFTITSKSATQHNILEAFVKVVERAPRDSLLILSYSGYAFESHGRSYLLPADGVAGKLIDETGISLDLIDSLIASSQIRHLVVLLDSSFHDLEGVSLSGLADTGVFSFHRKKNYQCTAIYYPSDPVYEDLESKQGLFSRAAVQGLKGAAQNSSGNITARSLAMYLEKELPEQSQLKRGVITTLRSQIACNDDFVISRPSVTIQRDAVTYYVSAVIHPSAELPQPVSRIFAVDDSGECTLKQTRSATFCLEADVATKIGDFKMMTSSCGSKPLGATIAGRCATVDYILQGCSAEPSCSRASIAFEVPLEGVKYSKDYLEIFESPRRKITVPEATPSFQYPGTIPTNARNLKWEYTAEVLRISHDEVIGDIHVTDSMPNIEGVKSSISGDGRLILDVSSVLDKWSHDND